VDKWTKNCQNIKVKIDFQSQKMTPLQKNLDSAIGDSDFPHPPLILSPASLTHKNIIEN